MGRLALVVVSFLTLAPALARADGPSATPPAAPPTGYQWQLVPAQLPSEPPSQWYRGEMVIGDVAAAAITLGGMSSIQDYTYEKWKLLPGGLVFAGIGPAIHLFHGDPNGAAKSLGLRVGLPLLGSLLLYEAKKCDGCYDGNDNGLYIAWGAILGGIAAAVIDDGFLAHDRPAERPGWSPVLAPARGGGAVAGITATF